MISVGDRIGCVTVLEILEAAQARERDLRGYRGKPAHPKAHGTHVRVRCDCLLEFLVRAREVTRRKDDVRCGKRCELGREDGGTERASRLDRWTKCRNTLCGKKLRSDNRTGFCKDCQWSKTPGGRRWFRMSRPAEWRDRQIARMKASRAAKALRGECVWCPAPSPGGSMCATCKARYLESCRARRKSRLASCAAWRARKSAAGLCLTCSQPAAPGRKRCARHLAADSAKKLAAAHRIRKPSGAEVAA